MSTSPSFFRGAKIGNGKLTVGVKKMLIDVPQGFLERLENLLCGIQALESFDNRTMLLDGLPSTPVDNLERQQSLSADLHTIVQAVNKWGVTQSDEYALKILLRNAKKFVLGLKLEDVIQGLEKELIELVEPSTTPTSLPKLPFTNRDYEIALMFSSFSPAYYLVDAPAGYGKTEFLKELKRRFSAPEQNWRCAYAATSSNGTLANLTTSLAKELEVCLIEATELSWGDRLGGALQKQWENDPKEGLILLIDINKRPALPIVKELLEQFIPEIQESLHLLEFFRENHNRFRVVLAGRYLATSEEVKIAQTKIRMKHLPLAPFNHKVICNSLKEQLGNYAEDSIQQLAAHLLYLTGGHPNCIAQILELYKQSRVTPDRFIKSFRSTIWKEIIRRVVEEIYEEIPESFGALRNLLSRLSIIRYLDYDILAYILKGNKISDIENQYDLADNLSATYLFSWEERLLKDDITRRLLAIRLRQEKPERFVSLCKEARDMCVMRLRDPKVQRPEVWMIEYLFQSLQQYARMVQDRNQRRIIYNTFVQEDIPTALQMFLRDRDIASEARQRERSILLQAIERDWEFRFTVNYYLRDIQYNDELCNRLFQESMTEFSNA
jgi:hypothetical protein